MICSHAIQKLLKKIPKKLYNHPFARVELPDEAKMQYLATLIWSLQAVAQDVIGFMDGLSLHSECNSDFVKQIQCTVVTIVTP